MAANSPHAFFDAVSKRSMIPLLSIVDAVAGHVELHGYRRVLLLGIRFTVEQGFYQDRLPIGVLVPKDADQTEIDDVIFGELSVDRTGKALRRRVEDVISRYECDAVLLGCTELPLLFTEGPSPLPMIDTAALHVEAALEYAVTET